MFSSIDFYDILVQTFLIQWNETCFFFLWVLQVLSKQNKKPVDVSFMWLTVYLFYRYVIRHIKRNWVE